MENQPPRLHGLIDAIIHALWYQGDEDDWTLCPLPADFELYIPDGRKSLEPIDSTRNPTVETQGNRRDQVAFAALWPTRTTNN